MNVKLKDEPVFLIAALCIFFPVGLILLIKSECKTKFKWLMGVGGGIIFISLLALALLNRPQPTDPASYEIKVTRQSLSVGQSGGFLITNGNGYVTDYTVESNNDILSIQGNLYTAVKTGQCTLTIRFQDEVRTLTIQVTDQPGTDSIVLASPSGSRYHLVTAGHAGKRAVEMTEEEALQSGKTPCKNCFNKEMT